MNCRVASFLLCASTAFGGSLLYMDSDGVYTESALADTRDHGRVELFLDLQRVESIDAGLTHSINKPTKYSGNPIFGDKATDTWDDTKASFNVKRESPTSWKVWYSARPEDWFSTTSSVLCYATSTNGKAWTRPTLNLYEYDGSKANNMVTAPTYESEMLVLSFTSEGTNACAYYSNMFYAVSDTNWMNLDGDSLPTGKSKEDWGVCEIVKMADGTWREYAQSFATYRSESVAFGGKIPTNEYTARANPMFGLTGTSGHEKYLCHPVYIDGNWLAFVPDYSETTEMASLWLYYSRDGLAWDEISQDWIPRGASGAWDSCGIYSTVSLVRDGNVWNYYYLGTDELHNSGTLNTQIGLVTIPYQRIGQLSGTGEIVTAPVVATDQMTLNVNIASGSIDVAVYDGETGTVIPGYDYTDCDTLTSGGYSEAVTWGGKGLDIGRCYKIGIDITTATIYAYSVGVPESQITE